MISVIAFSERLEGNHWVLQEREVMSWHGYSISGFLAGIRNVSRVPPITTPRGIPSDVSKLFFDEFKELEGAELRLSGAQHERSEA
jgi:hypothetical protein